MTRCPNCRAVANSEWSSCVACGVSMEAPIPRPDFVAPAPPDVTRIRETVKIWPRSFAQAWAELVVSAMVAGRDQHEAERLAFRPLAEDAPAYRAETDETPGPWPPAPNS